MMIFRELLAVLISSVFGWLVFRTTIVSVKTGVFKARGNIRYQRSKEPFMFWVGMFVNSVAFLIFAFWLITALRRLYIVIAI